jgi:hypothetical protein
MNPHRITDPRCPFLGLSREDLPKLIAHRIVALRQLADGETKARVEREIERLKELRDET